MNEAASTAARVAGAVIALAYLTGTLDGPLIGAVGGLVLVTFGRALIAESPNEVLGPAAFAVVAGSCGVVALRWGTLDLAELRGIQGVLGPTIAVEPAGAASAAIAGLVAGVVGVGVWLTDPPRGSARAGSWWWVEVLSASFLLVALFAGPQPSGWSVALWVGAIALVGAAAVGASEVARRAGLRALVLAVALIAVTTSVAAVLARGG